LIVYSLHKKILRSTGAFRNGDMDNMDKRERERKEGRKGRTKKECQL
jgi:hypothetical protein